MKTGMYGYHRVDLKTGVGNYIFWSEIGSGVGEPATSFPGLFP